MAKIEFECEHGMNEPLDLKEEIAEIVRKLAQASISNDISQPITECIDSHDD